MPSRVPTARNRHAPPARRDLDRTDDRREAKAFYRSPAWRRLRASILRSDPLCRDCRAAGRYVPAVDVHHLQDRADFPELALDPSNLEGLCKGCHNRRRRPSSD